jgi:hypothetical protein
MDTQKPEKKTYSMDEIRQLAADYRGEPENFDPERAGQKSKTKKKSPLGPKSARTTASTAVHR